MYELLINNLKLYKTAEEKYNFLREYLQILILKILDEKGYFRNFAFVGGTALRILYDLKRFSEDLDFCLVNNDNYSFSNIMLTIENELKLANFKVSIRYKDHKTVASAFIKFDELLYQTKITPHRDKKLMIKFEVDQNPPTGYDLEFSMINKDYLVGINHFDLPSLFAGKLHAVLCRKYAKGRDYYDFIWYISNKVTPNYKLLNQAILQTEHQDLSLDKEKLSTLLTQRFSEIDFTKIQADVEPFLVDHKETRFFRKQVFLKLVGDLET